MKINYLAMYVTILNNNTAKTTEPNKTVNENKPNRQKNGYND